jgi:hypothetical protein
MSLIDPWGYVRAPQRIHITHSHLPPLPPLPLSSFARERAPHASLAPASTLSYPSHYYQGLLFINLLVVGRARRNNRGRDGGRDLETKVHNSNIWRLPRKRQIRNIWRSHIALRWVEWESLYLVVINFIVIVDFFYIGFYSWIFFFFIIIVSLHSNFPFVFQMDMDQA